MLTGQEVTRASYELLPVEFESEHLFSKNIVSNHVGARLLTYNVHAFTLSPHTNVSGQMEVDLT